MEPGMAYIEQADWDRLLDRVRYLENKLREREVGDLPVDLLAEYDGAAEHFARHGTLPQNMALAQALRYINADPEAFHVRVREFQYAHAMESHVPPETAG